MATIRYPDLQPYWDKAQEAKTFEEFEHLTGTVDFMQRNPLTPHHYDSQFSGRDGYRRFYYVAHSVHPHTHHWIVEPMPFTKPSAFRDGDIDGELYSERYTRGNLKGRCQDCKATRIFHPFTGGLNLTSAYAPVQNQMMIPTEVYHGIPEGEAIAATLA